MRRWTIKPSVAVALLGMLFLFFVILVLPDVDLPDVAFHGGTAPVAVHARSVTAPVSVTVADFTHPIVSSQSEGQHLTHPALFGHISVDSLAILHRSLRC